MGTFADDVRACLAEMLGEPVPAPEGEPILFFGQWLAERNLGLVPVADAAAYSRPGPWLAQVGDHGVVMFGSPSGPWLDPAGACGGGAVVEAGWVLAPLDLRRPIVQPPAAPGAGVVASLLVAPEAEAALVAVDAVDAVAGRGLEGDRYFDGRGTFSGPGRGYEVTLVEAEVLDEIGLPFARARRNVVTRGIELNALVGRRFRVGGAVCVGRRLAEPCAHLEGLARPGLLRPLVHRGGVRADILDGGRIRVGDAVEPLDD